MNLLMLAFEFPPLGGVGVQRSLKFAKYLPEHGVRPVVVTPDKASIESLIGPAREAVLLDELPAGTRIERVPCSPVRREGRSRIGNWLNQFLSVGEGLGRAWRGPMLAAWSELVRREQPAALYVSVPPFSMAPLAVELAQRSGLPLILDFRDNWSQWCCSPQPSWLHYQLTVRSERRCLDAARAVVGVTRQMVADLQRVHPGVSGEKFHVVPNGYDAPLAAVPVRPPRGEAPFVIGYVGSFYYTPETRVALLSSWWQRSPHRWLQYTPRREDWLYRSPYFFFRSLARLLGERPELRPRVKVRFVGDTPPWLRAQVDEFGLRDVVEHLGRMSHRACLEFQASCDALLATSAKVIGGRDYCIAGKTFEYVASQVPIVAFVTEGEQRDFLAASGLALVCDADDTEAGARSLGGLVGGAFVPAPSLTFLHGFHRCETAGKMATLLRRCTSS